MRIQKRKLGRGVRVGWGSGGGGSEGGSDQGWGWGRNGSKTPFVPQTVTAKPNP